MSSIKKGSSENTYFFTPIHHWTADLEEWNRTWDMYCNDYTIKGDKIPELQFAYTIHQHNESQPFAILYTPHNIFKSNIGGYDKNGNVKFWRVKLTTDIRYSILSVFESFDYFEDEIYKKTK